MHVRFVEDKKIELAVINPGVVLGPLISKHMATSHAIVKKLLDRSAPAVAKMNVALTDVRDVAQAHISALTAAGAAGHRHLVVTQTVWLKDIALILKKEFQPKGYSVPSFVAPNVFVWLNSLYEKQYKIVVPRLGREFSYENKRMKEVLKVEPTETEKTIIDSAQSLIDLEIISQKKKKSKKSKDAKVNGDAGGDTPADATETEKTNGEVEPAKTNGELEPEDKEKPAPPTSEVPVEIAAN